MGARVGRVGPVVAHHEDPARRDGDREPRLGGGVPRVQVRLVERCAVDGDTPVPVTALHGVPADSDDPLDQVLLVLRGQQPDEGEELLGLFDPGRVGGGGGLPLLEPATRVLEDHHVTAVRLGPEPRGELVHDHPVTDPDGLLHRTRGDHEGLEEEGLEHEGDQQRHPREDRYLPHGLAAAAPLDPPRDPAPLGAPGPDRAGRRAVARGKSDVLAVNAVPGSAAVTHGRGLSRRHARMPARPGASRPPAWVPGRSWPTGGRAS